MYENLKISYFGDDPWKTTLLVQTKDSIVKVIEWFTKSSAKQGEIFK